MKLIRFGNEGAEKPGILFEEQRYDCSDHFIDWNNAFFMDNGLEKLQKLIENEINTLPKVSEEMRWASCVPRPGMIMCIGLNYSDHAAEAGMDVPTEPVLFMKATNTLQGPNDNVSIPKGSTKTDWEVELAVVLKKDISYLSNETEAEEAIAGYCIMHDVSERAFQLERGGQWVKGKSCPGFSPVGPFLVTPDEIEDVHNLQMQLLVNGELMQNGNTSTMIFKPAFIVHYLSQFMKLEAGDIITTGTPPGVGIGKNPQQFLKANDVVELSIDKLGSQQQVFQV
ncbi:MAG: fumarylacetoacetate hydrolase family protein [Reichenbachiella sp.]